MNSVMGQSNSKTTLQKKGQILTPHRTTTNKINQQLCSCNFTKGHQFPFDNLLISVDLIQRNQYYLFQSVVKGDLHQMTSYMNNILIFFLQYLQVLHHDFHLLVASLLSTRQGNFRIFHHFILSVKRTLGFGQGTDGKHNNCLMKWKDTPTIKSFLLVSFEKNRCNHPLESWLACPQRSIDHYRE